jgi:WhiB family redox-sensing transcriptional regulator
MRIREPPYRVRRQMFVLDKEGLTMNDTTDFSGFEVPVLDERPWSVFSACKGTDPTIFFAATRDDERAALVVCSGCDVRDECLGFAVETRERFGVWGGTTERERKRLLRAS